MAYPVFLDTRDIVVGEGVTIGRKSEIGGSLSMSDHTSFGEHVSSYGTVSVSRGTRLNPRCDLRGRVSIGRYCAIARGVSFQETEHDHTALAVQHPLYERVLESEPRQTSRGPITVGNDVWIGADSLVLSGVTIGDGAIIGGKSVVTDDVEPYSVVAGVPAEHKKYRFPEDVRERLLELRWWEWDESTIAHHAKAFTTPVNSVSDLPVPEDGDSNDGTD